MLIVDHYLLTVVLGILFAWVLGVTTKIYRSRRLLPPGPGVLRMVSNAVIMGRRPQLQMARWAKQYGPIYCMKMGLEDAIVVTDHKLIKELFTDMVSTGRLVDNPVVSEFAKGPHGLINSEGPMWLVQRRFTVKTLKDCFGSKASMEALIMEEVQAMLQWFSERSGKPILGNRIFNAPVVNSLWSIVSGERCEWEKTRPKILDTATTFWEAFLEVNMKGVMYAPVLRRIFPEQTGWNRYLAAVEGMFQVIDESIQRHKETFDPANLRDYIDHFLLEMERGTDPSFCNETGCKANSKRLIGIQICPLEGVLWSR